MAGQAPKQIMINASQSKQVQKYYNDVCDSVEVLSQNAAPYDETIAKADDSIRNIDKELDALHDRAMALEEQRIELEGVRADAVETRDKIVDKHCDGIAEINTKFFEALGKEINLPDLLDSSLSWDVDLQYMGTFGHLYILQIVPEQSEAITDSEDVSKWMDDINNTGD